MKQIKFLLLIFVFFNLCFSINKVYVFDITFKGNANIKSIELADLLRLQKKTLFTTTEFKSNKLNLDLITLQSYYKSNGYLDINIDYSYNHIDDYNISILFIISEGVQYQINNISITGNKSFDDNYILDLINVNSRNYNPIDIRNKLMDLKDEYLKIGKINISINESITKYDSLIDLQIDISEGRRFYIDNILISGLEDIDTELVLRELTFNRGDIYNVTRINQSKTHLFESQLFSSIEIFPYIESDTTIILDIRLRELEKRELEFQAGIGQLPSNKGDLPISAINVSGSIDRGNLFNSAAKASFKAEFGLSYINNNTFYRSYYELGLYSPWFINIRIPFRLKVYSQNILFDKFALGDKRLGFIAYVENYRSSNPYLSLGLVTEFFESENNRSIYVSYIKHNIDDFINPKGGYYISINPRLNGTFLGGEYNYLKTDIEFKSFRSIFNNAVYAFRFKSGFIYAINYIDNQSEIPDFDKFFLGGSSSLRGWVSPLDYNGEEGGLSRILVNSEIRIPLYKMIGVEFFYDAGLIDFPDSESNFNWNIGWGITVISSLGPLRLDFAFKEGVGRSTVQLSLLNMF